MTQCDTEVEVRKDRKKERKKKKGGRDGKRWEGGTENEEEKVLQRERDRSSVTDGEKERQCVCVCLWERAKEGVIECAEREKNVWGMIIVTEKYVLFQTR